MKLNPASAVPLHTQIYEQILELVKQTAPGERLFTDTELVSRFKVNRLTVRQAVDQLVREGHVYRMRGLGTFRAGPKVQSQVDMIERFWYEWGAQGRQLRVETTFFGLAPCPSPWAATLGIPEGEPVLRLGRLRYVDGIPFTVDLRFLPAEFEPLISRKDVETRPLWVTISELGNVQILHARNEIQAVPASVEEAHYLKVAVGFPLLQRRLAIYGTGERCVVTGSSAYRGDLFVYTVDIPGDMQTEHGLLPKPALTKGGD